MELPDPFEPFRRDMARINKLVRSVVTPRVVECPICETTVIIPLESTMTRTQALEQHLQRFHGARMR